MISDYLTLIIPLIIPGLIGAIAATISHYLYYKKTTHKENKTKFLERQITELLLPLDFHIKTIERFYDLEHNSEQFLDSLRTDTIIEEIATDKFYLASKELRILLLAFIDGQHKYNFQHQCGGRTGDYLNYLDSLPDNFYENYKKLKGTIQEECEEKIQEFQQNY
jgi:hypothetical protein